ncbi:MAG: anaerobic ribonucleoside-triphosphate reductase [Cetobacterium sp.]
MHKFAVKDTADFGIIEGITDKGYYDNSFHVSSKIEISPFDKLKLEAPFHHIATGGQLAS